MKKNKENKKITWDQIEGNWKQLRGKALQEWGKLMNDELDIMAGKYEELVGKLQEKYGIARREAEQKAARFKTLMNQMNDGHFVATRAKSKRRKKTDGRKRF